MIICEWVRSVAVPDVPPQAKGVGERASSPQGWKKRASALLSREILPFLISLSQYVNTHRQSQ